MFKSNNKLSVISVACFVVSVSMSTAINANHKTNHPTFDIAAKGVNYNGYTSIKRCKMYNPSLSCTKIVNDCGSGNADVYVTKKISKRILQKLKAGQKMPIHTMSATGHFLKKICTLRK
jgi:hypothetical protein